MLFGLEVYKPSSDMFLFLQVLVWHTRTEKVSLKNEAKLKARGLPGSDPTIEV